MTTNDAPNIPLPPSTPPTQPGAVSVPGQASTWPTAIGIIAIILGAGGALMSIWAAVSPFVMDRLMAAVPTSQRAQMVPPEKLKVWTAAAALLSLGAAILLLAAGIGIVQYRRWAPRVSITWAAIKMIVVLISATIGFLAVRAQMEAAMPTSAPVPMTGAFASAAAAAGMCVGLVWGWALPIFMLIWFSRSRIKTEVATWT